MARHISCNKATEKDLPIIIPSLKNLLHMCDWKACTPPCGYIKPSPVCLSLQEFQPTQRNNSSELSLPDFPLAGAKGLERKRSSSKAHHHINSSS
jgi:hypothetical protein